MILYVDENHRCHTTNSEGNYTPVETVFFDGKCDDFVEGHCYEIKENGYAIYAWKSFTELDNAQREYERQKLADAENALAILLGGAT